MAPVALFKKKKDKKNQNTHTQLYLELKKRRQFGSYHEAGDSTLTLISKNGIQRDRPHPPHQIGLFVTLSWRHWCYVAAQVYIAVKSLRVRSQVAVSPCLQR